VAVLKRKHEFSKVIGSALILALFAGGLPSLSGVTVTASEGPPAFSLDICHAAPGMNHGLGFSPVPLNNAPRSIDKPPASGATRELEAPRVIRASEAPDPPPPKSLR
jgi:hypothetical protein